MAGITTFNFYSILFLQSNCNKNKELINIITQQVISI